MIQPLAFCYHIVSPVATHIIETTMTGHVLADKRSFEPFLIDEAILSASAKLASTVLGEFKYTV